MKKVLKPAEREEASYYSDFTGKPLGDSEHYGPNVKLTMDFSYGSEFDGAAISLHLSDEDAKEVFKFLASKISSDCRKEIQKNLEQFDARYDDAMDSRAWHECDLLHNNRTVLKKLLNLD
jgi:hypothetical protein